MKIKALPLKYSALLSLATNVLASLTGNAAFATPVPSLSSLTALIATLESAITAWGAVGNRGSHADLLALRSAALDTRNTLVALANYVLNTASIAEPTNYSAQAAIIGTSGFAVRNAPAPQGVLGVVQGFHQQVGIKFSPAQPRLRWRKPLGLTSPGNVKTYQIWRGATNSLSAATLIANSTTTAFTDTSVAPGTSYFYFIVPINAAGSGVATSGLAVAVPA